jgi:2-polyprenyl-6-methoxyphenol hydroxylase-like FAD-dependent oxidoreductase
VTAATADAIVVGAGPAGLASAIALARAGVEPVVYERRDAPANGGSGLTLWPNALRALASLGVADAVRAAAAPIAGVAIRSWRGALLSCTAESAMRDRYGDVGVALHRADLVGALAGALPPGAVSTGSAVSGLAIDDGDAAVRLADGGEARAGLVVGADGMRSLVRSAVLGPIALRAAGYTVWRGVADFPLEARTGTLSMGRGAQFGLFPMTRGRCYWFASLSSDRRDATRAELIAAFAGWHEPIQATIDATDFASVVRTDVQDARPLRRRRAGGVVLVGDAAHPSSPALGQGACQAIEDGVVLGRCLSRRGAGVAPALADYERRRVGRTNRMTRVARRLGKLGQWRSGPACWVRDRMIAGTPERLARRNLDWQFGFDPDTA